MKLRTIIPSKFRKLYKRLKTKAPIEVLPYHCPLCKNDVSNFDRLDDVFFEELDKNGYVHSIFSLETLNLLHYSCPKCLASDRARLYALYFEQRFKDLDKTGKSYQFLDIAPDKTLSEFIKSFSFIQHRSVDLYMEGVDDQMDITQMDLYEDNRFDAVLCSHVLEHIKDDRKALSEIYRILKPNGFAIIMVPIYLDLESDLENPKWTSVSDKWKYYGQYDHVRADSKSGFVKKLSDTGFKVHQLGIDHFGVDSFLKNGIHERSILYVVEK